MSLVAVCAVAACGRGGARPDALSPEAAAGYLYAPAIDRTEFASGQVTLSGAAAPGAEVRLASPSGAARTVHAARDGTWRLRMPAPAAPQIFGLSMMAGGRRTQAQGYVLVGPNQAALLRPGAGALRLDARPPGPAAIDFDRQGAGVVSGFAPPDASLTLRVDGRYAGEGRAEATGRFFLSLPSLAGGRRRIEVAGDNFTRVIEVDASPPEPLADGPLRSQFSPEGLRADWLTPGGGVQSTLLPG